ncbi:hypothetical protein [Devosia yakushimensis]|uniref:hypothetical protein n=1 Tax=Devosia yakushimensis TaxID=470028 RepID=UPI0024E10B7E|nr:hypothetical protein [Devosia yakushimensis]
MLSHIITPAESILRDFPEMTTRLHANRLVHYQQSLQWVELKTAKDIAPLFSAFRATKHRAGVSLANPFARPLRIGELVNRFDQMNSETRSPFEAMRNHFLEHGVPATLELPAYAVGPGQYFLLDGNHRAAGLYLVGADVSLRLRVLNAPIDRRFLIDLKYWDGGWRRFLHRSQK